MSQITTGVRAGLSRPWVYDVCQWLMGGRTGRTDFVQHMIRAGAHSRVLDIGCGTGTLLRYLPGTVEYEGFDISGDYIAAAKASFGSRGRFTAGALDGKQTAALPPFDIVVASALLHHMDDDAVRQLLGVVRIALRAGGRFVSIDPVLTPGQNRLARFLIERDRGQNVRDPEGYLALVGPAFDHVRGVLRHRAWVPYTHWMMEGTLTNG